MNLTFDNLKRAWRLLKRRQTWLTLGLAALFFELARLIVKLVFRNDALQVFLNHTSGSCRELSHGAMVLLGCGTLFFGFACVRTLGEIRRWLVFRRSGTDAQVGTALTGVVGWSLIVLTIAAAALFFFARYCR